MLLALRIGMRYARSRRSFISFVSVLSLAGLALSVATLVFVQAVVAGFEREMNERVLGIVPHITVSGRVPVQAPEETLNVIRALPEVAGASAVVEGPALLATAERVAGVRLTGIDPQQYGAVSRLFEFANGRALQAGQFNILIGAKVAERLQVAVGDHVALVLPQATATPLGVFARQKRFHVAGVVDTGSQLDRLAAYLHRRDAARLYRLGNAVHGFHVRSEDALQAGDVRRSIVATVGAHRFRVSTWFRSLGNLYAAIQITRNMLFLLLSLLVAVAAFNLVSSLVMIVNQRRGDIAMLRTMGGPTRLPIGAFMVLGAAIAGAGVMVGIGAGIGLGLIAEAGFPWLEELLGTPLMGEYLITRLPIAFAAADLGRIAATAMGLCLLATLVPAWRAARLNPADVLQHE